MKAKVKQSARTSITSFNIKILW